MNTDNLTVMEYQIFKVISSLDQETRTDILEFLQTHTDSDIETFKAGLTEILAK